MIAEAVAASAAAVAEAVTKRAAIFCQKMTLSELTVVFPMPLAAEITKYCS